VSKGHGSQESRADGALGTRPKPAPEPDRPCGKTETLVSWCSRSAEPRSQPALLEVSGLTKSFGWAEVRITDYGAGIPAGLADKTFEPRVQGTTEVAGTGLGLPITRGIIEAHGGTLVVAPADPGASFVVAHPADPPPDPRSATAGEPSGASWNVVEEPEEQRGG